MIIRVLGEIVLLGLLLYLAWKATRKELFRGPALAMLLIAVLAFWKLRAI